MTYIETKKAEARMALITIWPEDRAISQSDLQVMDSVVDTLLNDIESRVVPKCIDNDCDNEGVVAERDSEGDWIPAPCQYCHQVRFPMREAFQHLRTGVETEV